jgi:ribosomal protein S30
MPTHGALSEAGKIRSLSGSKKDGSKLRPNPMVKKEEIQQLCHLRKENRSV